MSRILVSSFNLLREAEKVDHFRVITLALRGGRCLQLHSTYHYHSQVPCESQAADFEARVKASDLVGILRQIADQPITLDLHENMHPVRSAGKVYALKFKEPGNPFAGYDELVFDFAPYF